MYDIIIIGGGPAGLAAALYASRGGARTVLFESVFAGGQMLTTNKIENYPAFDAVEGTALAMKMEAQAKRFGAELMSENVLEADLSGDVKRIKTTKAEYEAHAVIIATGALKRKLGVEREEELVGGGVSYCATCDGAFFRGMPVAVVGGGDTALSDAVYLAAFAEKVYLIHRRDEFRAAQVLTDAVKREPKVELVLDSVPQSIIGTDMVEGINVRNVKTGEERRIDINGLFIAVGITPNSAIAAGQLGLDSAGAIVTDAHMRASMPGVFAAGDVRNTPLRQIITGAADGAVAATSAIEYIRSKN